MSDGFPPNKLQENCSPQLLAAVTAAVEIPPVEDPVEEVAEAGDAASAPIESRNSLDPLLPHPSHHSRAYFCALIAAAEPAGLVCAHLVLRLAETAVPII